MEQQKISFKDLSIALKISMIGGFISAVSFIIGAIIGFVGAI